MLIWSNDERALGREKLTASLQKREAISIMAILSGTDRGNLCLHPYLTSDNSQAFKQDKPKETEFSSL